MLSELSDIRNGALKSAPFLFRLEANLLPDDHRIHRAICAGTGGDKNQLQRMDSERKLSGIIPACLIGADIESFVDCCHENTIQIKIHLSIRGSAFIN